MKFADLADLIRRELPHEQAERLCRAICREAAGEQIYIPARHGEPEILPSDTPKTVQKRYGVSRQTAYNWVNKWRA